jgi:predicted nucleic acid-binding protein
LRFYDRLKDTPRYSLSQSQIEQIEDELADFRKRPGKEKGIRILPSLANEMAIRTFLTRFGLEVADAFHLALAKRFRCTIFVTRDNDFLRKKKKLEATVRVVKPAHVLTLIHGRRGKAPGSMQEGKQQFIFCPRHHS